MKLSREPFNVLYFHEYEYGKIQLQREIEGMEEQNYRKKRVLFSSLEYNAIDQNWLK